MERAAVRYLQKYAHCIVHIRLWFSFWGWWKIGPFLSYALYCEMEYFLPYSLSLLHFPGGSDGIAAAYNEGDPVRSLGREDPLEKDMATHASTLAWKIPWTEEPGRLQSTGS